jgi:hypothetical protein
MRATLKCLLIVALLSTATVMFAQEPLRTTGVAWSPDGRLIAVSARRLAGEPPKQNQVYTVRRVREYLEFRTGS